MHLSRLSTFLAAALSCAAAHAEVLLDQTIPVEARWNAVYVEVAPTGSLSQTFASWPTDSVGLYDPAAFLATRQYSASASSQGMAESPIAMWHRHHPEATDALALPANTVCIFFASNAATLTVRGVPAAPRTTWHATGPKKPYNFFGLSLQHGKQVTAGEYLAGFPGIASLSGIYRVKGANPSNPPVLTKVYASTKFSDDEVLLVPSSGISDWSGTLFVSPMDGLDFSTNLVRRILSVRNDSGTARTAEVSLVPSVAPSRDIAGALHWRDTAVAVTNPAWNAVTFSSIATKLLAPGETWKLDFGLDRALFDDDVRGTPFGAVLRVTDADGGSFLRVDVPIQGAASGRAARRNAWPGGLWVATVAFDQICGPDPNDTDFTETGGVLKVRLPFHVDAENNVRLLQRVVVAGETAADGTFAYSLYAGAASTNVPSTARETMRISSAVLPTETPVVPAAFADWEIGALLFAFPVSEGGATSLLRHPTHPQHDGLKWDFSTPLPSGDDFSNYQSSVKPELFSVTNEIVLLPAVEGDEAAWNPEERKSGACTWTFGGLRREGTIMLHGKATFERIAPETNLLLE